MRASPGPTATSTVPTLSGSWVTDSSAYRRNGPASGCTSTDRASSSASTASASSDGSAGSTAGRQASTASRSSEGCGAAVQNGQRGSGSSGCAVTSSEAVSWTSTRPDVSTGSTPVRSRNTS